MQIIGRLNVIELRWRFEGEGNRALCAMVVRRDDVLYNDIGNIDSAMPVGSFADACLEIYLDE